MGFLRLFFTSALLYASLLPEGDCITGGKEAKAHSRPYMASLQLGGKHQCGGFLISSQWLMSAAHCFQDDTGFKVVLGAHSVSQPEDTKQTFDIAAYYPHPDFSTENYDNDIVLVKLNQPVTETAAVKPVKFQQAGGTDPATNAEVDTAGWGANSWGQRLDQLQELTITMLPRHRCNSYGVAFTDNMFCSAKPRMDTCDGDSGGPLLYNGIAVGITSNGGRSCGSTRKPGLYTIISHYSDWITSTMTK
ncbi:complement factor D isoform X1 [Astyanax mexicanus]|uniref:complement factor D isoform X1 n=1 Tax=Astyanax mexicanus TaxID=7994 RepID=UPI000440BC08|nr:complement factor D isoform X1 [Astyanax mexicanus]